MAVEIERKFLVKDMSFKGLAPGVLYCQGYLSSDPERVVRVRLVGALGFITVKGRKVGFSSPEYEYPIPVNDAREMLDSLCQKPLIEKYRYRIPVGGIIWEVDEFLGANQGLIVAEIELTEPTADFSLPEWLGEEVTGDPRYQNSNLIQNPYQNWQSSMI